MRNPIFDEKTHPVYNRRMFRGGDLGASHHRTKLDDHNRKTRLISYTDFRLEININGFRVCRSKG